MAYISNVVGSIVTIFFTYIEHFSMLFAVSPINGLKSTKTSHFHKPFGYLCCSRPSWHYHGAISASSLNSGSLKGACHCCPLVHRTYH